MRVRVGVRVRVRVRVRAVGRTLLLGGDGDPGDLGLGETLGDVPGKKVVSRA